MASVNEVMEDLTKMGFPSVLVMVMGPDGVTPFGPGDTEYKLRVTGCASKEVLAKFNDNPRELAKAFIEAAWLSFQEGDRG